MTTVLDIITASLKDLGAIAISETPTASEADDAFNALNNLMESFNNEDLLIYNIEEDIFNYQAGQATYTLGTGGDFDIARPVKIVDVYNRSNNGSSNQIDLKIYYTTNYFEFSDLIAKRISSGLTMLVYDNSNYPLRELTFYPIPIDNTYRPVIWSWKPLTQFSSTNDLVSLPTGYKRMLQKNLAIELAPSYGRQISDILMKQAIQSKAVLKRTNSRDVLLYSDFPAGNKTNYWQNYQNFLAGRV